MPNQRDTHFLGFAKLLYDEIGKLDTSMIQRLGDYSSFDVEAKKLIAQFAYDLGKYVYNHTTASAMIIFDGFIVVIELDDIPDLTQWPTKDELQ
jgi:hypothetical protein